MSRWSKEALEQMMCDCVDSLYPYMTASRSEEYTQNGYPVNELIDNVMSDIKWEVLLLIKENNLLKESTYMSTDHDTPKLETILGIGENDGD